MDHIEIAGLEVWGHHGVLAHEQELGQRFLVDVRLELDLSAAAASDDLDDTVDYGALAARLSDAAADTRFGLIERLAGHLLQVCLEPPQVRAAEVTVHKPSAPLTVPAREVRVVLRRERDG